MQLLLQHAHPGREAFEVLQGLICGAITGQAARPQIHPEGVRPVCGKMGGKGLYPEMGTMSALTMHAHADQHVGDPHYHVGGPHYQYNNL